MRFENASKIVGDVAIELGLGTQTSPYTSQDPAIVQLRTLLNSSGKLLYGMPIVWEQLIRQHSFTTSAGKTQYKLPSDFGYMIDQTQWTTGQSAGPIGLPSMTNQEWGYLQAWDLNSVQLWASFRQTRGVIDIYPSTVAAGIGVTFDYVSRAWAIPSGEWTNMENADNAADAQAIWTQYATEEVDGAGDLVLFEPTVISRLLKMKWLQAKGFDSTGAVAEFETALTAHTGRNKPRKVLDLNRNYGRNSFITNSNLPYTNYGADDV